MRPPRASVADPVTGLSENENLVIATTTGGYVDIYPQAG